MGRISLNIFKNRYVAYVLPFLAYELMWLVFPVGIWNPVYLVRSDFGRDIPVFIPYLVDMGYIVILCLINMVLMKGINENEVDDMFEFCKKHGIILQLIELMDSENCDDEKFSKDYHYNLDPINEKLLSICDEVKTREFMQNRKKYFIDGGEIEVVKPIENSDFCANCTRLRITPDGKIKPCLLRNDNLVELISHIRNNESDSQLKEVFIKGINKREPYNN